MSAESDPILTGSGTQVSSAETSEASSKSSALFYDSSQSPGARLCQLLFVALVVLMVMISVILSIYRGVAVTENGFMYFLLGLSLTGFAVLEIIMIMLVRRGDLPKGKTWFLYIVGGAVILQSIFTDVALFE